MSKNLAVALGVAKANPKKESPVSEDSAAESSKLGDLDYKALAQAILEKMSPSTPEDDELSLLDDEDDEDFFDSDDTKVGAPEDQSPLATIMSRHLFKGGAK